MVNQIVMRTMSGVQRGYKALYDTKIIGPLVDRFTATLATSFTFFTGTVAAPGLERSKRPDQMLELYVYEGCPFCRKVLDTVSVLCLDVVVYPCPRVTLKRYGEVGESRYRGKAIELGGSAKFPLLVDKNVEPSVMYESEDIIKHLWTNYGNTAVKPWTYFFARKVPFTGFLRNLFRPLSEQGMLRIPSVAPEQPLILWGYEGSPAVIRVKELLSSLELHYIYRTVPIGATAKRKEYRKEFDHLLSTPYKATGFIHVPVLVDPNADNKVLFHSSQILEYLRATYCKGKAAQESMMDYTTDGAKDGHQTL